MYEVDYNDISAGTLSFTMNNLKRFAQAAEVSDVDESDTPLYQCGAAAFANWEDEWDGPISAAAPLAASLAAGSAAVVAIAF